MEHYHCLNCNEPIRKNFCPNCGQKTDTQRITFRHFVAHDLLHGVWHLERGILFTAKEAIVRPGKASLDYIGGKRIRYYNVFYLSLILIGIAIIISHLGQSVQTQGDNAQSKEFIEFFSKNIKLIVLGIVPLMAINAWLLFRKMKLNFAEHIIAAGFAFLGVLVLVNMMLLYDYITGFGEYSITEYGLLLFVIAIFLFPTWAYANLTFKKFSFLGTFWRLVVFYLLLIVEIITLTGIMIWLVTGSSELVIS